MNIKVHIMRKILFLFVIISSMSLAQNYGSWTLTDSLNIPRWWAASAELDNGNILVTGGEDSVGIHNTEIYNYENGLWEPSTPMIIGRFHHMLVKLNNGNVMAIGGFGTKSCEIYDTTTKQWSLTDSLHYERSMLETATVLNNGNVLVTGGYYLAVGIEKSLNSCEIYNVGTGKWNITDSLKIDRFSHTATKLLDGRVLVAGGFSRTKKNLTDCEIYDPNTGKWTEAAPLNVGRYEHSATLLPDGNVLVMGGEDNSPTNSWLNSCELYNPAQNSWTVVDSLIVPHSLHSALLLKNGLVLIAGGGYDSNVWELYNPGNFTNVYMGYFPSDTTSLSLINLLPNGKVLAAGGFTWTNGNLPLLSAAKACYIYDPGNINGIKEGKNSTVKDFELYQNYPNPFNPSTTIEYDLPKEGFVDLSIYNILGKRIITLVQKVQPSGKYSVSWSGKNEKGTNISSGIYFYQLREGNFTATKKFLLLK